MQTTQIQTRIADLRRAEHRDVDRLVEIEQHLEEARDGADSDVAQLLAERRELQARQADRKVALGFAEEAQSAADAAAEGEKLAARIVAMEVEFTAFGNDVQAALDALVALFRPYFEAELRRNSLDREARSLRRHHRVGPRVPSMEKLTGIPCIAATMRMLKADTHRVVGKANEAFSRI